MAKKIEFELVSPERLLVSQPVDMVVAPGSEGYFGVLVEHIPMMTTLGPGVIEVYEGNRLIDSIFVDGGFAEVTRSHITILVEQAIKVKDLDRAVAEQEYQNLKEDLEDAQTDTERAIIEGRILVARAKVEAVLGVAVKH